MQYINWRMAIMKYLDKVKVIKDKEIYKKCNINQGMIGTIIDAEIRDNCFHVIFVDKNMTYTAEFKTEQFIITVESDNETQGSVHVEIQQ